MSTPPARPSLSERIESQRVQEAIAIVKSRGALKDDACPQCGVFDWDVDFLAITAELLPEKGLNPLRDVMIGGIGVRRTSGYLPALAMSCKNCGNTLIFNLKKLGLEGEGQR